MSLSPDILDQAYQFFIEEATELLHTIEMGLLELRSERTPAKIHEVMRAAHSIKGGSASVELDVIKTISHRLETIFKALYHDSVEFDAELETALLEGYDCLRVPLMEQIETGQMDEVRALSTADAVLTRIEVKLGDALKEADNFVPTSADLGVDIVASIFEVDVMQGIERLEAVKASPDAYPIAGEMRAQLEVFTGLAEILNLPGFGEITQLALTAVNVQPDASALEVLDTALVDFRASCEAVLGGDRAQGGSPSDRLRQLAAGVAADPQNLTVSASSGIPASDAVSAPVDIWGDPILPSDAVPAEISRSTPSLADVFGGEALDFADPALTDIFGPASTVDREPDSSDGMSFGSSVSNPSVDDVFGQTASIVDEPVPDLADVFGPASQTDTPALEDVFGQTAIADASSADAQADAFSRAEPGAASPALDDVLGQISSVSAFGTPALADIFGQADGADVFVSPITTQDDDQDGNKVSASLEDLVQSATQQFDQLPSLADHPSASQVLLTPPQQTSISVPNKAASQPIEKVQASPTQANPTQINPTQASPTQVRSAAGRSIRVDLGRMERMNNLVGELVINRNSLSLQNEQLQGVVKELLDRFNRFQGLVNRLQDLSDQMIVESRKPESRQGLYVLTSSTGNGSKGNGNGLSGGHVSTIEDTSAAFSWSEGFDALEMDRYNVLHSELQEIFEEVLQLEEAVGDVTLFAGQSDQTLSRQRQRLNQLQNELMWARMLPLGNVLNRFPRTLRDLSNQMKKPVELHLGGTNVLVDKSMLERLYDPLLHLLRNAFDHGIEPPEIREQKGKSRSGNITIRAFHRGNQTIVEIQDDGRGINLEKIGRRAQELGWLTPDKLTTLKSDQLLDFMFEPGFSTAEKVTDISGRGVGLDVVRSQLRELKGTVEVSTLPDQGTTFTLKLPLTLTISKLLTFMAGNTLLALPSDSIEEIVVPQPVQLKHVGNQRFLHWDEQLLPLYSVKQLVHYNCHLAEAAAIKVVGAVPAPPDWALPLLLVRRGPYSFALEVDRLLTEQELVIKPFGAAITPPSYIYGCTILSDGRLVPVMDATVLIDRLAEHASGHGPAEVSLSPLIKPDELHTLSEMPELPSSTVATQPAIQTILVVDDSAALRRTLALTLQKNDYRVLQARDGLEALDHLEKQSDVKLVICDVEMPNMNGFEFLSQRRRKPEFLEIPVVMLTSRSSDKHRRLATQLGANAYLSKPYIEHELLATLNQMLSKEVVSV